MLVKAKWVLVIEDSWEDFALIRHAVKKPYPDLLLEQAHSADRALEMLRESSEPPALILVDYKLPGMSGLDAIFEIRTLPGCADLPVVAMSNLDDTGVWMRRGEVGLVDFLTKKVSFDEFIEDIRSVLSRWL